MDVDVYDTYNGIDIADSHAKSMLESFHINVSEWKVFAINSQNESSTLHEISHKQNNILFLDFLKSQRQPSYSKCQFWLQIMKNIIPNNAEVDNLAIILFKNYFSCEENYGEKVMSLIQLSRDFYSNQSYRSKIFNAHSLHETEFVCCIKFNRRLFETMSILSNGRFSREVGW
jgi:hypothetical protein